jgi:hypothetical protein
MNRLARMTAALGVLLACLVAVSCSDLETLELSSATLEGSVTYQNKPVPYALVIVTTPQSSSTANADASGKFKVEHAPVGQAQIGVNTDAGRGMMMSQTMAAKQGGGGAPPPAFVDVPKKYFDPKTSGITTTVADGPNTFDIKLQ